MELDTRRFTIGGSECAAAAGVHPYMSPIMLWAQKTGRVPGPEGEQLEWGTRLEAPIMEALTDRGYMIEVGNDEPFVSSELEWVTGTPDGFVTDDTGPAVLEIKTVNVWAHRAGWEGDVPPHYAAQAQWYMHLTGLSRAMFAVLVGGQKLEVRWVNRSDHAIRLLLRECERFRAYLLEDRPPPPDGSDSSREALHAMFPQATAGAAIRLGRSAMEQLDELRTLKARRAAIDRQIEQRENLLRSLMGEAESAVSPHDVEVIRWTNTVSRRVNVKRLQADRPDVAGEYTEESSSRRFTII